MSKLLKGWSRAILGEVAKVQTGPFGSQLHNADYVDIGTPMITVEHIVHDKIQHTSNTPKVSDKDKKRLSKYTLKKGDIVFSRVGSVDRSAYVSIKEDGWMFSGRLLRVRADIKKINSQYLHFYLTRRNTKEYIKKIAVGATMPSINTGILSEIPLIIPPHSEQKAITSVLSVFDEKIELLQEQNKTLETLAQTIFKEWFIEKAQDEWEEVKLSDVLELKYGKDHKALSHGAIPVYGSGGIMRYVDSFLYNQESILIPRKGTLTNIFYVEEPFWTVDTIFWSKINKEKVSTKFLFSFLKTMNLSALNVGSAVPSLTTKVLNEVKLFLPSLDEQKQFNEYADNAWGKMKNNKAQIQTLSKIRDTLLPKLMSGELRVDPYRNKATS